MNFMENALYKCIIIIIIKGKLGSKIFACMNDLNKYGFCGECVLAQIIFFFNHLLFERKVI